MAITPFYKPGKAPNADEREAKEIVLFLERELNALSQAFTELYLVKFRELHVEPERPRDGMFAYADGVNWDPGSGEGHYGRVADAWIPATIADAPAIRAVRVQTFTASGTYTPHAAMLYCIIEAVGGGAGGGGVAGSAAYFIGAGGGGSGGYSRSVKTAADIGASKTVTIGAGGAGGAAGANGGAAGGATSVGSLVIANGGTALGYSGAANFASAASYGWGGLGGAAGTGDLAMLGRNAQSGFYQQNVPGVTYGVFGNGGDSHFGRGGASHHTGTGQAGSFGGGGGGASVEPTAANYAGGAGGAGLVVIKEFCSA